MTVRDKEAELLWRGQQYDRAIQLYRRKNAAPGTPSIDALVQGKFLRKRYKDPITGTDFDSVGVNAGIANAPGVQQPALGVGQLIGGVRSRSKATSFLEPDGATTYQSVEVHLRRVEARRSDNAGWRVRPRRRPARRIADGRRLQRRRVRQ